MDRWLLDSLADGVVLIDPEWRVAHVNPAAESLLSIQCEAVRGKEAGAESLQLPRGWVSVLSETMEKRRRRKLSPIRFVQGDELRYYAGEVHPSPTGGIAVIFRDVTEHKHDEEVLRLRDRALAASPNGVVLTDATQPDNPIIYANPAFLRITGYEAGEVLGRNCRFLQGTDGDQPEIAEVREAVQRGEGCTVTLRNYRKDGTLFWNQLSIAPVRDGSGQLTHFVGIQQDVTERKRAQDALVERNEQLKTARDELASRHAELREATRAKDRFMATMSHEMRTPLNAILGYVELMNLGVAGDLTDGQRAHLGRIAASGRALLDLINDVLDFTRAEAGRLAVDSRPLNPQIVVDEAVELVRLQAEHKGIELHVERPSRRVPWVLADFRRLRQILTNLLANGIKFTQRGEVRISFEVPDPDTVAITVRDTGIGIEPEKISQIFTEFYQADSALTREYGGSGLGLAISSRLARLMGGDIEVESEPGRGSKFTLLLRSAAAEQPGRGVRSAASVEEAAVEVSAVPVVAFGQDPEVLEALRRQLEPRVRLVGTTAPGSVPELAKREQASLIVLDVACQDGAGWEAAHAVREEGDLDDVAMLLLPCFPEVVDEGAGGALDLGWVAVVPKPFAPEQLSRIVHRAAARDGGPETAEQDILIVDDDPDALEIASRVLGAGGARVREAHDGEAGLAAMRSDPPDVAVLDLMMPVLDGFGVLAAMRSDPNLRDIPVVVLTAKDLSEPERRFLSRTAETVLQKGIHPLSDVASMVLQAATRGTRGKPEEPEVTREDGERKL